MTTAPLTAAIGVSPRRESIRRALVDVAPVCVALAPIGFVLGVTIAASRVDGVAGWAGGPLLASGAAHFSLLALLGQGAGAATAVLTAVALSSRNALYSAALAPRFADQPRWFRWVGPYFLVDQLFAMVDDEHRRRPGPTHFRRYYLGLGASLTTMWAAVIAAGMVAGPIVPASWHLELMVVVLVVAMIVPTLANATGRLTAAVAFLVAVLVGGLPRGVGLPVAALAAMVVAAGREARR